MFDFHFLQLSHIFQQEFSSGDVQMPLLLKTAKFFPIAKWMFFDEGYWKDHP